MVYGLNLGKPVPERQIILDFNEARDDWWSSISWSAGP